MYGVTMTEDSIVVLVRLKHVQEQVYMSNTLDET